MADLILEQLTIAYGNVTAVDNISLSVPSGEFLTLLGPSGCGKSTTLFSIAGLNQATSGTIRIGDTVLFNGENGTSIEPEHRNIGLVFQSYALWPHMSVGENLAFPLKLRKVNKTEREKRIKEALALVEMAAFADRYPFELSGGQQQRVALARALVYRPGLLLLDEPLSNLDAKLRERARIWLRELQERLQVTTVYVTHDQAEALAVSDRIAVMSEGRIRQLGTPKEIYETPADAFVADFIGSSNFLKGKLIEHNGPWANVQLDDGSVLRAGAGKGELAGDVVIAIRPERIEVVNEPGQNILRVDLVGGAYLGSIYQYEVKGPGGQYRIQTNHEMTDKQAYVRIPPEAATLFRGDSVPQIG
ncbi:ABC transporter ATP-binding protein [Pusillimonas sp. SM2304]|uniref:ABC transporter ATP-binding protein n=1 Tax=Pusillimonas sp. SM2304 TaxID=3073241 RepID=UPI0028755E2B|nr:ABC transporter ATP-binding protein [Pusillimonas sp. SM2304]MDS1139937.1 ABC transporter ATP-binding protein [Pusillimonas sp. SM2304]